MFHIRDFSIPNYIFFKIFIYLIDAYDHSYSLNCQQNDTLVFILCSNIKYCYKEKV